MKQLLISLLMLFSLISYGGDGNDGQSNENNYVRITSVGLNQSGQVGVRIVNKQACKVEFQVNYHNQKIELNIEGHDSAVVYLTIEKNHKVQVKPKTNCTPGEGNLGNVELSIDQSLPIIWVSKPVARWLDKSTLLVEFEVADASGANHFLIKTSEDGRNWKVITLVFPAEIPDRKYSIKIKF